MKNFFTRMTHEFPWKTVVITVFITLLISCVLVVWILPLFGINLRFVDNSSIEWEDTYYVASIVGVIIIPIAVVYIQHILSVSQQNISGSNVDLLKEVERIERELDLKIQPLLKTSTSILTKEDEAEKRWEHLKNDALKTVNISIFTSTTDVASKLEIEEDEAYKLLVELALHDKSISIIGRLSNHTPIRKMWGRKA